MNTDVLFETKEKKLVITLNKDASYKEIKDKLAEILASSDTLFDEVDGKILVKGNRLLDGEEIEITNMLQEKTPQEVEIERPKQMGLATINNIFTKDTTITQSKVITGTISSGKRVYFEVSIIFLWDVNGGAELIAEGNIIVLGNLRGFAHAGAKGNRAAFIAANSINPTQLRIADIIMKNVSDKKEVGNTYEIASVKLGEIVIEK